MTPPLSATDPACPAEAHYTDPGGRLRCTRVSHRLPRRWADAVVCPFCGAHFTPARGSAISHIRACARHHGTIWPI